MPLAPPALSTLCADAQRCTLCPGVRPASAVLGPANGPVPCDRLFVGEAPGRFGAGRTGVPFQGDEAGRRFGLLLAEAGLERSEVFLTNAILCLPLDAAGRNRHPRSSEVGNCQGYLRRIIDAVEPKIVVAMGAVALEALGRIEAHGLTISEAVGRPAPWGGLTLAVVYHPGRQAQIHRSWEDQCGYWQALGRLALTGIRT